MLWLDTPRSPRPRISTFLETVLAGGHLAGGHLSQADLYCGGMADYVARTSEGRRLVEGRPNLHDWLEALRDRDSFKATFAPMLANTDQF